MLFHAVIILGISFKLPDIAARTNTDNTLDVVLLNASNNDVSNDTELVSSTDNTGGGTDDKEASSPIPYEVVAPSPIQTIKKTAKQQETNRLPPDQLLTSAQSTVTVSRTVPDETRLKNKAPQTGQDKITTNSKRQLEHERLIAKINQSWENYQKRPKKTFLSPSTKAHGAAEYLDKWRKSVVKIGNANYPAQAKAKGLSGTLILTVEINTNGTINAIKINSPSKYKVLNDAALRFVRDASPFAAFPDEDFFKPIDILVITRAFHFLPGNQITSTAISQPRWSLNSQTNHIVALAFDIGLKRTGVAVGQSLNAKARPVTQLNVKNGRHDTQKVDKLIAEHQPNVIVLGQTNTTNPHLNKAINRFKSHIQQQHKITIIDVDERLSTTAANTELTGKLLTQKQKIALRDQIAACLILETYFNQLAVTQTWSVHVKVKRFMMPYGILQWDWHLFKTNWLILMLPFKHLTSSAQLDPETITQIFNVTDRMMHDVSTFGRTELLDDKMVALLFFEPSSRTMLSFQTAAERMKAGTVLAQNAASTSMEKGESIEDLIQIVSSYADIIVMRHAQPGSADIAASVSSVPFINAGDGGNEHPTQSLIDIYTIYKEKDRLDNLNILFGFDSLQSRSIHSLTRVLAQYPNNRYTFVGPKALQPNEHMLSTLNKLGVETALQDDVDLSSGFDIAYLNRLQEERFANRDLFEQNRLKYRLQGKDVENTNTLILDPLPRVDEISTDVDSLPNAAYFKQASFGVPMRMALLAMMLRKA